MGVELLDCLHKLFLSLKINCFLDFWGDGFDCLYKLSCYLHILSHLWYIGGFVILKCVG